MIWANLTWLGILRGMLTTTLRHQMAQDWAPNLKSPSPILLFPFSRYISGRPISSASAAMEITGHHCAFPRSNKFCFYLIAKLILANIYQLIDLCLIAVVVLIPRRYCQYQMMEISLGKFLPLLRKQLLGWVLEVKMVHIIIQLRGKLFTDSPCSNNM